MPIIEPIEENPLLVTPSASQKHPENFDSLSKEDQNALLDHIAGQFANYPKAMERLASAVTQQVSKDDFETIPVLPQAGFVIRTKIVKSNNPKYKTGTPVYINICHAPEIPAPPVTSEDEVQKALNADPQATYRVPLSMSQARIEKDAAGKTCLITDACINTQPYVRTERDLDYRLYILELSIEWAEEKESIELDRGKYLFWWPITWVWTHAKCTTTAFSMPKMTSKGQISKLMLRLPKSSILSTLDKLQAPKKADPPSISVKIQGETLVAVVSNLPQTNPVSWSLDIEPEQIIVGLGSSIKKFTLPQPVIVNHASNSAKYYRKSRDLVVQLAVAPNQPRTRYL